MGTTAVLHGVPAAALPGAAATADAVAAALARAGQPSADALRLHPFYRGKMETVPKCRVRDVGDFAVWYTPGVAAACRAIATEPDRVYDFTGKWNTVAVVSDGSRVLGLGDIGPKAGLPVMEGKALLYKYLGGVDAVPIMVDDKDPAAIVQVVKAIQPSFGGINLEDISQPKCFRILDALRRDAEIPVWHDDQQGTATVMLAGLLNALKVVGKRLADVRIAFIGAGAASVASTRLIFRAGAEPSRCVVVDSRGILNLARDDLARRKAEYVDKWRLCQLTNADQRSGGIREALAGMDVAIALSQPGPGTILPEWVARMASGAILFACANPVPEIWPWEAAAAGAAIVASGRSDFPNQVNNSLGFPGILRGALDVRARTITDEMCLAAARALAGWTEERGALDAAHILPTMDDWQVFPREATAVAMTAQEQGVARLARAEDEVRAHAEAIIERSHRLTECMMREGFIPPADGLRSDG